jgi:predicted Zn-dependent peptidase
MKRAVLLLVAAACGGHAATIEPGKLDLPAYSPRSVRDAPGLERPPEAAEGRPAPFPKITATTLRNGVEALVVRAPALPIVQIRVLVRAGMGYAPTQPGAAELTAQMLKDGGTRTMTSTELLRKVESLGADLSVAVGVDATTVSIAVTTEHWAEALAILGEVVQMPRLDPHEYGKLKARATDAAEGRLRGSGQFVAMRAAFEALYGASPYAKYAELPAEIAKVGLRTIKDFHKRFYVPKSTSVVVVGDVAPEAAGARIDQVFGAWSGEQPPQIDFPPANPIAKRRVIVLNRRESAQSDVFVVGLAPARSDPGWPQVRVANQVLGGGVAGRLFLDVREQRSLAYSSSSHIVELAHGEQPVVAYASTRTEKTAECVSAILENLERIARGVPTEEETETARRYLSDVFALRTETIGSIADMIAELATLRLPLDYWDKYRDLVKKVDPASASAAAARTFHADRSLVVVAGNADAIAASLARFGDTSVLDPERDFVVQKTIASQAQK